MIGFRTSNLVLIKWLTLNNCIFLSQLFLINGTRYPSPPPELFVSKVILGGNWKWVDLPINNEEEWITKTDEGFVIPNTIQGILLTCESSYPVKWVLNEDLNFEPYFDIEIYNGRKKSIELPPESWKYIAQLRFWSVMHSYTGNYTCQAVSGYSSYFKKSTFLFFEGHENYMVNAGKEVILGVDARSEISSPCGLSTLDTDIEVKLFREEIEISHPFNTSIWKLVSRNESIKYDPRIGFTFKVNELLGLLGSYKCLVDEENEDDVVHFDIILAESEPKQQLNIIKRINLEGSAVLDFNLQTQDVTCCSNSKIKPNLSLIACTSAIECEFRKKYLLKDKQDTWSNFLYHGSKQTTENCTTNFLPYFLTFWIKCQGEGVDILSDYYLAFNNKSTKEKHHFGVYGDNVDVIPADTQLPLDSLIFVKISGVDNVLIRVEEADNTFYSGRNASFDCTYSVLSFGVGAYWEVLWKNGDKKRLENDHDTMYMSESKGFLVKKLVMDENMVSISCYTPVWSSSEWGKKVLKVDVKIPTAPQFDNLDQEEIRWNVNDTNQQLECTFSGKPVPKIIWMKDGKELIQSTDGVSIVQTNGTSLLTIKLLTHDFHGQYSCIGRNFAGDATKIFMVFIEENNSVHALVIAAVVLSLLLVTGILVVVLWKNNIHRKILRNMTASTYQ